uniref:Uncharacterized protein n=1 Tax=Globodera rostochiensis TaxID=31243 RepID=A0A914IA77_GLORO
MRHPLHSYAVVFVEFTYFVQIFAVRERLYPAVEEDHQQHQYDQLDGAQPPAMMGDKAPVGPPRANQQRVRQRKGGAPPRRKESSSHNPFVQPAVPGPFATFANDLQQPSGHAPPQQQFHQQQQLQQGPPTNYAHPHQAQQNAHHPNQYYPQIQNNNAPLPFANGTGAPPPQPPYRHSSSQYAQQPQQKFIGGRRHGTAPQAGAVVPSPPAAMMAAGGPPQANPIMPPNYAQQNVVAAALSTPLADLLLPEPVPDLLTDSVPSVVHQQQTEHPPVVDSSVPLAEVNSLMDQMSIVPKEGQQNLFGTMEVYYTELEQKKMDQNGKEQKIVWEIYRQRDNSKKFVKFRHVNKRSGDTEFSCVAPLPGKGLTKLFFNNNPNLAFSFDASGYMLGKASEFAVDAFTGWPLAETMQNRKYDYAVFQKWVESVIDSLLKDEKTNMPVQPSAVRPPTVYPSKLVLQWVQLPLPVHAGPVEHKKKIGFVNLDVKQLRNNATRTNGLDKVMEQMDDGGNWLKIEVKQGTSRAVFVRDLNGQAPNIVKPMVLFFNGHRWHFDKTGMAISHSGVDTLRKWKKLKQELDANDTGLEAFLAENRAIMEKERMEAAQKAAAELAAAFAASTQLNYQSSAGYVPNPNGMNMLYTQQQQFAQPFLQTAPNQNQHHPQLLPQQQHQYLPMPMNQSYRYYMNPKNRPLYQKWPRKANVKRNFANVEEYDDQKLEKAQFAIWTLPVLKSCLRSGN